MDKGKDVALASEPKGFWRRNAHLLLPGLAAAALAGAYWLNAISFEPGRHVRLVLAWVYIVGCLMAGGAGIVMLAATFWRKPAKGKHLFVCQVAGSLGVAIYLLLANTGLSVLPR
jgi:hypothetical protein